MFDLIDGFTAKVVGGFLAASIVVALIIRYQDSKAAKPNTYTEATFTSTPEMPSPGGDPYTEAAYHQQPSAFAAATGDTENTNGTEVLNIL